MKPAILLIGDKDIFLLNIFRGGLLRAGFEILSAGASVADVAGLSGQTKNWFICAGDEVCHNVELLEYIKGNVQDGDIHLYVLGSKEEIGIINDVIPADAFEEIFYRPANVPLVAKRLWATIDQKGEQTDKATILIVDDDVVVGRAMEAMLKEEYITFLVTSGLQAIQFLREQHHPDLVLMDVEMPGMNGFEAFQAIRDMAGFDQLPIIFLTGTEIEHAEERGLASGASDFIQKPVSPGVLMLRVRHTVELNRLREHLAQEVERQTSVLREQREQIELMTMQIVEALSGAIDAKDSYTQGHSLRVAQYSQEIAKRFGYSEEDLQIVYITGILHDVGKIGIPNAIINSPNKLTDEEYAIMKTHPAIGAQILEKITTIPNIAIGAHWHHERYDGRGYPDGLKGEDIPEIARIIGVADAYDAMTSRRSYRKPMPQEKVREQIEGGLGSQFDPTFGQIMLEMIDEDKDYLMQEGSSEESKEGEPNE